VEEPRLSGLGTRRLETRRGLLSRHLMVRDSDLETSRLVPRPKQTTCQAGTAWGNSHKTRYTYLTLSATLLLRLTAAINRTGTTTRAEGVNRGVPPGIHSSRPTVSSLPDILRTHTTHHTSTIVALLLLAMLAFMPWCMYTANMVAGQIAQRSEEQDLYVLHILHHPCPSPH